MNQETILLRYNEIALKGNNRSWFENRLATNACKLLERTLGTNFPIEINRIPGRILLETDWNQEAQEVLQNQLFGLSSLSRMIRVPTNLERIREQALNEFKNWVTLHGLPQRFQIKTRRSEKALPQKSMEIDRYVGTAILNQFPSLQVDLKRPDLTLGIEIRLKESFLWTEKIKGQGGLPVGTNGRVLSLISGGLDSPVAAIQILKRGTISHFIHFYGTPFVSEEVLEKIYDLVKIVNRYQPDPQPLHVVPFGKIQEKIALATYPKIRTILYRRMMIRISNEVAKKLRAQALVTGESLGQVASQTVENLGVIDSVAQLPLFRPLISDDKAEIIEKAKKWGSYETSIRKALDSCTLFSDRHPSLKTKIQLINEQEKRLSIDELVQEALDGITVSSG